MMRINKRKLIKRSCALALALTISGCSNIQVSDLKAPFQESNTTDTKSAPKKTDSETKIKITEEARNVDSRFEIIEAKKVDDGKGEMFNGSGSALREVMVLRDKEKKCKYLYTYSLSNSGSGSTTMTPLECEKGE
ncbi:MULTISPECIES: hypothetical protein [Bacillus cereus group]|uniref:hypothetical protein n=1 Tax=Bacillus cereus group TaxID=86661 RepID=UPI00123B18FB|nr:hypothetical protein [Bacillus cereus]KAA6456068.1 hypothetical protein DX930_31195 [Bacillus cereus]KAB2417309.1 hypothetical protein F8169_07610 [Bacillus cereus]KAB2437005.1 hypothetical protein F8166_09875 [Bacillus cereus]KAB2468092.1 hypothetical protein F8164_08930 [Bacillus cereus]